MAKGKNVLTTGDVAKICNVAPRTVSKWFDSGQLKGYRIPGSKDRRIPVAELVRFMKVHNIPTTSLKAGVIRVIIADSNEKTAASLADNLRAKAGYEVAVVKNTFEAGAVAQKFSPHVILVNFMDENIDAEEICKNLRADEELQTIKLIAIANQLSSSEANALLQKGFDGYVVNHAEVTEIIRKIEQSTAIIY
jgi:excisionase family DNA binding protein